MHTGGRPIEMIYTPAGHADVGRRVEARGREELSALRHHQLPWLVMAHRGNYLDLDPTYRDSFGRPMLRMTFDFTDNEHKMSRYLVDKAAEIALAMDGASTVKKNYRTGSWSVVPYQTTHNTGGAIMGDNPKNSVVNKYSAELGCPQPVLDGRGRIPAERRLQPDRHGGGAGLSVGRRRSRASI